MTINEYLTKREFTPTLIRQEQHSNRLIALYAVTDSAALSKLDSDLSKVYVPSYTYYILFESEVISAKLLHITPYLTEDEGVQLFMEKLSAKTGS